ncbi:MAG: tetratricopeptide repeat protein [Planctomycetota bacterium]
MSLVVGLQLLTSLVIAGIVVIRSREDILRCFSLAVPALAGVVLCIYFPVWNRLLLSRGKYHRFDEMQAAIRNTGWLETLLHRPEILTKLEQGELVYYGDGIGGFTTVLKYPYPLGSIKYSMANSGKIDASSRGDMKTQTLLAHFPMLFHRDPKTVMVLGLASGITAGEVLHYPVEQLDVIDISREVVTASDFFLPWNNNVLSNPTTNMIVQDGRAHLQLTRQKYDVIISEPSNPWMAGLATLFTRDFFALAKDRLNENGIFVQFIHSYQMDWHTFALVGRAFEKVFPNSLLVLTAPSGAGSDYLLVGFKGKGKLTLENAQQKLSYARQSKNITLADPKLLCRLIVSEDLQRLFGSGPLNTDNWPRLEFAAPKLMYIKDPMTAMNIRSRKWLSPQTNRIVQQITTDVDLQIDFAVYALSVYQPFRDMVDLSKATPSQKERFFKLMETYCVNNSIDTDIFGDDALKQRCYSIQIEVIEDKIDSMPDKAISYLYLGNLYYEKGVLDEAIRYFSEALRIKPELAEAHYNLGVALAQQGRLDEAITHFTRALRVNSDLADAHYNLGIALAWQGKLDEAIRHFTEVLRVKPDNSKARVHLGIALARQDRLDEAVTHFSEALRIEPDLADAHHNLGATLIRQDKLDEAIRHFTEVTRIKPDDAKAHLYLGVALSQQAKLDEAIKHFTEALRINPNFTAAQESLEKALLLQKNKDSK